MHLSVKSGDPYGHTFSLYPHCAGIVERHTKGNGLPWHFSEIRLAAAPPWKEHRICAGVAAVFHLRCDGHDHRGTDYSKGGGGTMLEFNNMSIHYGGEH